MQSTTQPSFALEEKEIKKDYKNGNFFAPKGTKLKGEIFRINNKTIFRWYNTDKNAIESSKKGSLGVVLTQDIPMEYFLEEYQKTESPNSGLSFSLGLISFAVIGGGLFLIYKVIKAIKK